MHAGECSRIRLGNRTKLFGQDVILIHRLLKRNVDSMNYLMVTEAAARQLADTPGGYKGSAAFDHLGQVDFRLFDTSFLLSDEGLKRRTVYQRFTTLLRSVPLIMGGPLNSTLVRG